MTEKGRRLGRAVTALLTAAFLVGSLGSGVAQAATVTDAWQARVGRSAANGTATINRYLDATGAIVYKLKGLRASTTLPVTVHRGTCASVGSVVVRLASVRTTSGGAVARTAAISASQMKLIAAAGAGSGKLAVRIGTGSALRCGAFARVAVAPYVAARVTVGSVPSGVAVNGSDVYVTNWWDNTISRVSASTNAVAATLPVTLTGAAGPEAITFAEGSLWITTTEYDGSGNPLPGQLIRLNPGTGATIASLPIGGNAYGLVASPGAIWASSTTAGTVIRVDTATNSQVASIPVVEPTGLAFGHGSVWVAGGAAVSRIDPATNQVVATIALTQPGVGIAVSPTAVWVSGLGSEGVADSLLTRIDPATNAAVASVAIGIDSGHVTFTGNSAWVAMQGEPVVVRVSAATNTVVARVPVAAAGWAIASSGTTVWATQSVDAPDDQAPPPPGYVTRIGF